MSKGGVRVSQETTCCFTGHRPHRLPWHEDEWDERCLRFRDELDRQVERAYDRGYRHFIAGMAQGSDLMFSEAVLRLKQRHPEVQLEAAIPCPEQADRWKSAQQERYRRILAQCDLETLVQQHYTPDCMLRRNYYMVDRSSLLIALFDGNPSGGTCKTLLYAIRQALDVIQLDPNQY
jgi:uncharacterized phage-like protein YoqJ